jgi:hypothetical protein
VSAFEVVKSIVWSLLTAAPYLSSEDEEQYQKLLEIERQASDIAMLVKLKARAIAEAAK